MKFLDEINETSEKLDIAKKHKEGRPLSMVTAYDYTSAYFVDKADVDIILVLQKWGVRVSR